MMEHQYANGKYRTEVFLQTLITEQGIFQLQRLVAVRSLLINLGAGAFLL